MTRPAIPALFVAAAILAGCSSSNGVSTAAILESAPTPPPAGAAQAGAAVPIGPTSTPTDRAFQVGSVSARATKCGYNFDAARLKSNYLANEMGRGTTDTAQLEKVYQVAYNGTMKAAVDDAGYCSDRKTQAIKTDLNRLLAGDFEPPKKAVVVQKEEGFFSGLFGESSVDSGPSFGSDDWWAKQAEKSGN